MSTQELKEKVTQDTEQSSLQKAFLRYVLGLSERRVLNSGTTSGGSCSKGP